MKLIYILKILKKRGVKVFTTPEFCRYTGMSPTGSRKFLLRYTQHGVFWQMKRGLYSVRDDPAHPWAMANKLYRPSYISLETALSYYGMIPETVYGITSITTKITRQFEACNLLFLFHKVKQNAYTGYYPLKTDGETILVAEREKALADYFYFVHLGIKKLNERLNLKGIQKNQLWVYLKSFGRTNLMDWSRRVISSHS